MCVCVCVCGWVGGWVGGCVCVCVCVCVCGSMLTMDKEQKASTYWFSYTVSVNAWECRCMDCFLHSNRIMCFLQYVIVIRIQGDRKLQKTCSVGSCSQNFSSSANIISSKLYPEGLEWLFYITFSNNWQEFVRWIHDHITHIQER